MPSSSEHLQTARANYAQQVAELSDPAARKVSYSIDGRSVSWTDYQRFLLDQIRAIDAQLANDDPGEIITASVDPFVWRGPYR